MPIFFPRSKPEMQSSPSVGDTQTKVGKKPKEGKGKGKEKKEEERKDREKEI